MNKTQFFFLYTAERDSGFNPRESWVVKAHDRSDALVKLLPKLFLSGRTIRTSKHRELFLNDQGSTLERKVFVIPLDQEAARRKRFVVLALGVEGVIHVRTSNRPEKTQQLLFEQLQTQYGSSAQGKFEIRFYRII